MTHLDRPEQWFGDVERPPMTQQELREAALRAMAPDYQPGGFAWLEHHLGLFRYKPGWSWGVIAAQPWTDPRHMLTVRVLDPNQQLAQHLQRHRILRVTDSHDLTVTPSMRFLEVRSATHPDHPAATVEAMMRSPIPPYVDAFDELARWFLYTVEHIEMQLARLWLKYRDQPVEESSL